MVTEINTILSNIDQEVKKNIPTYRKRRTSGSFTVQKQWIDSSKLTDDVYDELWERMGLANKLIRKLTRDRFDKWFKVEIDDEEFIKKITLLNSNKKGGLNIQGIFKLARSFAKRHGYSVIYIDYVDQGETMEDPLVNPRLINKLNVIRKTDIQEIILDDNPESETFGEIKGYVLKSNVFLNQALPITIHASRTIHMINGDTLDVEGISDFKPMYNWLNVFDDISWSMGQSYFRYGAGFPVLTVKGWGALPEDQQDAYMNQWKNVHSMTGYVLGEGDTIKFEGVNGRALSPKEYFEAGLALVAAAGDLPYALIVGVNAGAVTGSETNLKDYYSDVSSAQTLEEEPLLEEVYNRLQETGQLPDKEFVIKWNSLFEENPKEKAEADKLEAEAREVEERTGLRTLETQTKIDNGDLIEIAPKQITPTDPFTPTDCNHKDLKKKDEFPRIEEVNGKRLVSEFSKPKYRKLEDNYYKQLLKIFGKMQTSSIEITRGFFTDKNDAINGKTIKSITRSIDKVFAENKKDFLPLVKTNTANAFDSGVKYSEDTLKLDINVPATVKTEKLNVIQTEHDKVLKTLADDINKDIAVKLGITALNPVKKFSEIEQLIKDSFSSKEARLKMGVGNEINSALNQGNLAGFDKSGVVVGKIWVSIIDGVTTDTCISLNGEVRPIGEAFSTGDYAPPASNPPHPCRSSLEPITAEQAAQRGLGL